MDGIVDGMVDAVVDMDCNNTDLQNSKISI